jgi:nanoRNase/pAp phosphatase (c-di-AMP/oligoRNAs hydrolase)
VWDYGYWSRPPGTEQNSNRNKSLTDEIRYVQSAQSLLRDAELVLVVVHCHADFDSIGSAVGIAETLAAKVTIAVPSSVQSDARPLLAGAETVDGDAADPSAHELVVTVDAPSADRVAPVEVVQTPTPLVVVDHHEPGDLADAADAAVVDTDADATAVLVSRLLTSVAPVSGLAATALAAGILDDTGGLTAASSSGVETLVEVLTHADDEAVLLADLFDREVGFAERVATAKVMARADGYKAGQTLLLLSRAGSHETAAAQTLLDGGADIAVVFSNRTGESWVVARTADRGEPNLHLPDDLFDPLVDRFGGHGGGHAGAGIAKLDTEDIDTVETACLNRIQQTLGMTFGRIE